MDLWVLAVNPNTYTSVSGDIIRYFCRGVFDTCNQIIESASSWLHEKTEHSFTLSLFDDNIHLPFSWPPALTTYCISFKWGGTRSRMWMDRYYTKLFLLVLLERKSAQSSLGRVSAPLMTEYVVNLTFHISVTPVHFYWFQWQVVIILVKQYVNTFDNVLLYVGKYPLLYKEVTVIIKCFMVDVD